jgi:ATP-dependent 26S proteasome regulatory subunit
MTMLNGRNSEKTRLVIIEDADEIAEKNGTRGSNLSRLLNATDGLIGASSNLLVLLSTNAPPEALDRALLRPGRCLASIEFTPFSADEVTSRLGRSVGRGLTLAELYEEMGEVSCVHTGTSQPAIGQYL